MESRERREMKEVLSAAEHTVTAQRERIHEFFGGEARTGRNRCPEFTPQSQQQDDRHFGVLVRRCNGVQKEDELSKLGKRESNLTGSQIAKTMNLRQSVTRQEELS